MWRKLKALGFLTILAMLTVILLMFIWAIAKIGLILTSFLAGVMVGFCCGLAVRPKPTGA